MIVKSRYRIKLVMLGVFLLAFAGAWAGAWAQDPISSQYYANPLFMNPAMAGIEGNTKVSLGYRNQWPSAGASYSTYHAAYEQYLEPAQGGIGVHLVNDRQGGGVFNTMSLDAMYAYHLKVTRRLTVTGGFQASVGQRSFNSSGLVLPDDLLGLPTTEIQGYSKWYPDFAVGFAAFYKNIYGGFSSHHLLEPYMSPSKDPNTKLSRRYTAHLGAMIPVYEKRFGREVLQLSPNIVFLQQDIYQQINYGIEVVFKSVLAGVWVRQDLRFSYGTAIFSVGYARDKFRFRYSYDARLSAPELYVPTMGAHELSLIIIFENLYKSANPGAIKSPKI